MDSMKYFSYFQSNQLHDFAQEMLALKGWTLKGKTYWLWQPSWVVGHGSLQHDCRRLPAASTPYIAEHRQHSKEPCQEGHWLQAEYIVFSMFAYVDFPADTTVGSSCLQTCSEAADDAL